MIEQGGGAGLGAFFLWVHIGFITSPNFHLTVWFGGGHLSANLRSCFTSAVHSGHKRGVRHRKLVYIE